MRDLTRKEAATIRAAMPILTELTNDYIATAFTDWLAHSPGADDARTRANAIRDAVGLLGSLATRQEAEDGA